MKIRYKGFIIWQQKTDGLDIESYSILIDNIFISLCSIKWNDIILTEMLRFSNAGEQCFLETSKGCLVHLRICLIAMNGLWLEVWIEAMILSFSRKLFVLSVYISTWWGEFQSEATMLNNRYSVFIILIGAQFGVFEAWLNHRIRRICIALITVERDNKSKRNL